MNQRTKIAIFLSSPADVLFEREAAERVVARLSGRYAAHVELAATRWERHIYEADRGFQEAIAPMAIFDVVVGILWKRIGSELPPDRFRRPDGTTYESGTVYEIETALEASRRFGRPSVYVFRCKRPITYSAETVDKERAQKEALDRWWGRTFRDEAGRHVAATNGFGDTAEFEAKLEDCLVGWLRRRGHIPSRPVWDLDERKCSPYPGLVAYDRERSPVFFGRQLAIRGACDELLAVAGRKGGLPALFVIGASGSGKSSLARAGLVPHLTEPGIVPGVDLWRVTVATPAADSLAALAARLYEPDSLPELAESPQPDPGSWARMAAGSPEGAAGSVGWALERAGGGRAQRARAGRKLAARLLLVVDQLESLFGTPGQRAFAKVLRILAEGGGAWLLATMRSDRYGELQLDPDLLALKRAGASYDLPPPGPAEIADIVKGPARAAELLFEEREGVSLARALVEAAPDADALPLLQMTLAQLFEKREKTKLTFAAYEAIGGIDGAIATYADAVFARAPPFAQREFEPLVRALVRDVARKADRQIRFTARAVERKAFETNAAREKLVEVLVDGRLLVSDVDSLRVAHEALLRRWRRARESIERLADAELRRERRWKLAMAAAAGVFAALLVVSISLFVAFVQGKRAERIANSRAFAAAARNALERGDAHGALRLALEALPDASRGGRRPDTPEAALALADAVLHLHDCECRPADACSARADGSGSSRKMKWAAFAPHGGPLVAVDDRGLVRVWRDADGGPAEELQPWHQGEEGTFINGAVDQRGRRLALGYGDGTVVILEPDQKRSLPLRGSGTYVTAVDFSPDGARLLVASGDRRLMLWTLADGRSIDAPLASLGVARAVAFDPTGGLLAAGTGHGRVELWTTDLEAGRAIEVPGGHGVVRAVRFSPDGSRLLAASEDGTVTVWKVGEDEPLGQFGMSGDGHLTAASVSRDGAHLLTGWTDGNARIWEFEQAEAWERRTRGAPPLVLSGQRGSITAVGFSPDGQRVVAASNDGTAQVWHARRFQEFTALLRFAQDRAKAGSSRPKPSTVQATACEPGSEDPPVTGSSVGR